MAPERSPDEDYDPQEHQACYVFAPASAGAEAPCRPRKRRRKTKPAAGELPRDQQCLFTPLLNGGEENIAVEQRWETYQRLWNDQEERTRAILDSFNQKTLGDVSKFVRGATPDKYDGKIPTGLVLAGPNIASHGPLFTQFATRIQEEDRVGPVVILTSKDAVNLKGTLKKLIKDATGQEEGVNEDEELIVGRKGAKLLNYDLQILQNWCVLHEGQKVVVAVQDTEAFDRGILADLISLFSAFLDRIPFVLLLGIATSLEIFHEKLPKATIRLIQGDKFDVEQAEECFAQVFNDAVLGENSVIRLGPAVCDLLIERQKNHTQSIQTFIAVLKYAYMSHFYANPLSVILSSADDADGISKVLSDNLVRAIRNVSSFRRLVDANLEDGNTKEVRALLEDDSHLRSVVCKAVVECRSYARQIGQGLHLFEVARSCISSSAIRLPRYELFSHVLTGELHGESPAIRDLLLSIKKMNSNSLLNLLNIVLAIPAVSGLVPDFKRLKEEIEALVPQNEGTKKSLTSEFDVASSSLRSTAVSKKIQLNQHKSHLSKQDAEYSKLVQQVHDSLRVYFSTILYGTKDVFLHELFFYDLLSPHKDIFAPRARSTVESALCRPMDYIGCECCRLQEDEGDDETMKSTHPPTSVIFQLYLEGGALINTFDLWNAFYTIIGGDDDEGKLVDEATAQALFYKSIGEMKFLGFLKQTRRRVDHLQKLAWKGL